MKNPEIQLNPVVEEAISRAGGTRPLAEILDIPASTVHRWTLGSHPSYKYLKAIQKYLGLKDDESSGESRVPAPITIYGDVAAGTATMAFEVERTYESLDHLWSESVYRKFTHKRIVYLRISGPSMEPDYPEGSLLACAEPSIKEIKPLTPVIAYVRGEQATFKLYNMSENTSGKKEIELIPLNRTFFPKRYKLNEVTVKYIVLGTINPWHTGLKPAHETKAPVLIDDGPRPTGPFKVQV